MELVVTGPDPDFLPQLTPVKKRKKTKMTTTFESLFHNLSEPIIQGKDNGRYPYGMAFDSSQNATSSLGSREVLMLTSNNYLGLADHPRVVAAASDALSRYGVSTCGSRLHNGTTTLHCELERKIADWLGYEDAVLFGSGFMANLGVLGAMGSKDAVVITDGENHESIRAGYTLGGSPVRIFAHNDLEKLEYILHKCQSFERRLVVVEGVYSMSGDIAPLREIADLCKQYGALLVVDDAHGVGVMGQSGRGTVETFDVKPDIIIGTFSKSLGSYGGFAVASREAIEFIRHTASAFILSAAPAASLVAAASEALSIIQDEPRIRRNLWRNTMLFRQRLLDSGFDIQNKPSPIIPIQVGDEKKAIGISARLKDEGIFLSPSVFPAVPRGSGLLRITCTAQLESDQIERAVARIEAAFKNQ